MSRQKPHNRIPTVERDSEDGPDLFDGPNTDDAEISGGTGPPSATTDHGPLFPPSPRRHPAYQCLGTGPFLLTIPGANGDASIFNDVGPYLAQDFTVGTYDRRGYSNSTLTTKAPGDLTMPYRLQRYADDAAALLSHLSGRDPAKRGNAELFYGREIAAYTAVNVSIPELVGLKNKFVMDIGEKCNIPSCNISAILASDVGVDLYLTPGGHLGYVSEPEGFARKGSSIFSAHGIV